MRLRGVADRGQKNQLPVTADCAKCANTIVGADGRTRTGTPEGTAPSRQRVYQFHHIGMLPILGSRGLETGIN